MPLIYQHNINRGTKLGIWHITEPEEFFLRRVPLKKDVSHAHKRLQHLAGRYLLPTLFDDFPLEEILVADTRKPFLENERYHFSISHCGNYAAAIVSNNSRVGVDIERIIPKIERIQHKFVSEREITFFPGAFVPNLLKSGRSTAGWLEFLTMLWSSKEAIFKWFGEGQVDFKEHIEIKENILIKQNGWMEIHFRFTRSKPLSLRVNVKVLEDFVIAWICTLPVTNS